MWEMQMQSLAIAPQYRLPFIFLDLPSSQLQFCFSPEILTQPFTLQDPQLRRPIQPLWHSFAIPISGVNLP